MFPLTAHPICFCFCRISKTLKWLASTVLNKLFQPSRNSKPLRFSNSTFFESLKKKEKKNEMSVLVCVTHCKLTWILGLTSFSLQKIFTFPKFDYWRILIVLSQKSFWFKVFGLLFMIEFFWKRNVGIERIFQECFLGKLIANPGFES